MNKKKQKRCTKSNFTPVIHHSFSPEIPSHQKQKMYSQFLFPYFLFLRSFIKKYLSMKTNVVPLCQIMDENIMMIKMSMSIRENVS